MFASVLIANRGEIACRIIKTAKKMGIRTIAVYSDADRLAQHVEMADEAFHIGPAVAAQSYLDSDKILDVAARSGAEAIHPGYGFLSENAEFAQRVLEAGLVWIGPPPDAIRAMGLKDAAKSLMEEAGVPVVPGYHGADQKEKLLAKEADKIGYPVLIKAVAGGGGKGMRKVEDPSRFLKELASAQREAKSAFGDDRVLVEKFVSSPRHVEVQVFADRQGRAVYLFERDCSLQRRHQKVVEEAPAPGMTQEVRSAMGEAAVSAAKSIGYEGAGTVEFIVDGEGGLTADGFFFMEMNTRLQVEHPVTEMITGEDLVRWQFEVAAGNPLPKSQEDLAIDGHAVEVRLYAEDPAKNFFPSPGVLHHLTLPTQTGHIRVDTGVQSGDEVTMFYDPMIAKIVAWGGDRRAALRHMSHALDQVEVIGARTNATFLSHVIDHPAFANAELDTGFIDTHFAELVPENVAPEIEILALAILALHLDHTSERQQDGDRFGWIRSPWDDLDGWRVNAATPQTSHQYIFDQPSGQIVVDVAYGLTGLRVSMGESSVSAEGAFESDGTLSAVINGRRYNAELRQFDNEIHIYHDKHLHVLVVLDPLASAYLDDEAGDNLQAPMSGKIIAVNGEAGSRVKPGEPIVVLEAMKMEHTLMASSETVIAEVLVSVGDQVDDGQVVVIFDNE